MSEKKQSAKLLRIFIGESDRVDGKPLYERIVYSAKKAGLAGATVWKGIMSFGANTQIHSSKILALSDDLPIIIEIVDDEEFIDEFIPIIDELFEKSKIGGLVTLEKIEIIRYSGKKK